MPDELSLDQRRGELVRRINVRKSLHPAIRETLDALGDEAVHDLSHRLDTASDAVTRELCALLSEGDTEAYLRWCGWYDRHNDALKELTCFARANYEVRCVGLLEAYPQVFGTTPDIEWALMISTAKLLWAPDRNVDRLLKDLVVEQSPNWSPRIANHDLVDLICTRPLDAPNVVEMLLRRPTLRTAEIITLLDGNDHAPALLEGTL